MKASIKLFKRTLVHFSVCAIVEVLTIEKYYIKFAKTPMSIRLIFLKLKNMVY